MDPLAMEPLPYVDDHVRRIDAPAERVWAALLSTMRTQIARSLPRPLAAAWGLAHTTRTGDWTTHVALGDTLLGFAVTQCLAPRVLTLRGRHRFSHYELRYELDARRPQCVDLHARTSAEFPGWSGRIYRALVIGSGGHRIAVRRLLATIARRAERGDALPRSISSTAPDLA